MKPKKLYLGKCLKDLNDTVVDVKETNITRLIKTSGKLFLEAKAAETLGDEERAFVLYMRYFVCISNIKKSKEFNEQKAYYSKLCKMELAKDAITKAEILKDSLNRRYRLQEEAKNAEKENKKPSNRATEPTNEVKQPIISNGAHISEDMLPNVPSAECSGPTMTISSLYALIKEKSSSFLVLDIRPAAHFRESNINIPQTVNIPEGILTKGLTAEAVTQHLDAESRMMWTRRGRVDKLVVLDWCSEDPPFPTPLTILLDAMLLWDPSTPYQTTPVVLHGGYEMWKLSYPNLCTNPRVKVPPRYQKTSASNHPASFIPDLAPINFTYPELDLDMGFMSTPSPNRTSMTAADATSSPASSSQLPIDGTTTSHGDASDGGGGGYPNSLLDNTTLPTAFNNSKSIGPYRSIDSVSHPVYPTASTQRSKISNGGPAVNTRNNMPTINRNLKPSNSDAGSSGQFQHRQAGVSNSNTPSPTSDFTPSFGVNSNTSSPQKKVSSSSRVSPDTDPDTDPPPGPTIPERSLKPRQLLQELANKNFTREKQLMEESVTLEKHAMLKLKELEMSNNNATLLTEMENLKIASADKEEQLARVTKENKELWMLINKVLANNNNNADGSRSVNPAAFYPNGVSVQTASSTTGYGDQSDRDKLASEKESYEGLKKQVEASRKQRKEKELALLKKRREEEERVSNHQKQRKEHESRSRSPTTVMKPLARGSPERGGTKLRRSHSAFDLSQLDDNLDTTNSFDARSINPSINNKRASKPAFNRAIKPLQPARTRNVNAARHRDFGPTGRGRSLTGLKNLGNTCYMNSIVQCLVNIQPFAQYFVSERHNEHINEYSLQRGEVAEEFGAVVQALKQGIYKNVAMKDFKYIVGKHCHSFRGTDQHDAHEFLLALIDWLHNDLNLVQMRLPPMSEQNHEAGKPDYVAAQEVMAELASRDRSIVSQLFYGLHRNVIECQTCGSRSLTFEPFSVLSLSFPTSGRCTLPDLLEHYYKGTYIEYKCQKCQRERKCIRKMDIWQSPPVLIIHLNRFEQRDFLMTKNPNFVDFPLYNLALNNFIVNTSSDPVQNMDYSLLGVSNHYGTIDGGHYTAFCMSAANKWHKYDDHEVYDIKAGDVKTSAAYVLCYQSTSFGRA